MSWFPISLFKHSNAHSCFACFGRASTNNSADTTVHFHTQTSAARLVLNANVIKPHLCNLTYTNHQAYLHSLISSLPKYNYIPAACIRFSFRNDLVW